MSTAATPPQPSPGFAHFLNLFNQMAVQQVASAAQIASDLNSGQRLQAISDGMTATAMTFNDINPSWGPDAAAAATVAQTGLAIVATFMSIWHKPKPLPTQPTANAGNTPPAA
jgi:hypothetical protein